MPAEIQMPNLGLSIAEGTIEKWLKKEGDAVEKGEVIVVIMTEKVTVEIPAEVSGRAAQDSAPGRGSRESGGDHRPHRGRRGTNEPTNSLGLRYANLFSGSSPRTPANPGI